MVIIMLTIIMQSSYTPRWGGTRMPPRRGTCEGGGRMENGRQMRDEGGGRREQVVGRVETGGGRKEEGPATMTTAATVQ
eukprot:2665219-Pyramimonas_sp.AAC.2